MVCVTMISLHQNKKETFPFWLATHLHRKLSRSGMVCVTMISLHQNKKETCPFWLSIFFHRQGSPLTVLPLACVLELLVEVEWGDPPLHHCRGGKMYHNYCYNYYY